MGGPGVAGRTAWALARSMISALSVGRNFGQRVDCSGMVKTTLFRQWRDLAQDASQQALTGEKIARSVAGLPQGDLLFSATRRPAA